MLQTSATPLSSLNYQSIFDNALVAYRKKTGKDLRSDPLLAKLETCSSPDAVLTALRDQLPGFDRSGGNDDKLTRWLDPTVNVLLAFSSTIGAGASLVKSQPAHPRPCALISAHFLRHTRQPMRSLVDLASFSR